MIDKQELIKNSREKIDRMQEELDSIDVYSMSYETEARYQTLMTLIEFEQNYLIRILVGYGDPTETLHRND
jgi:hypothetical protein